MKKDSDDFDQPFGALFRDSSLDLGLRRPNSSMRSFGFDEEPIPTSFQEPELGRRTSSRLKRAGGDHLVRGPSERA